MISRVWKDRVLEAHERTALKAIDSTGYLKVRGFEVDGHGRICGLEIAKGPGFDPLPRPIPEEIGLLTRLETLNLSDSFISELPPSIGELASLRELDLSDSLIEELPWSIGELASLRELDLSDSLIAELPSSIGNLASLRKLNLSDSSIAELPSSIGNLASLRHLNLQYMSIEELPSSIGDLVSLRELNLSESSIVALPPSIGRLQHLEELDLFCTESLKELPSEIGLLQNLQYLGVRVSRIISAEALETLAAAICNLANLEELAIDGYIMASLPHPERLERLECLSSFNDELFTGHMLELVHCCPALVYIETYSVQQNELWYAIACKRIRICLGCGGVVGSHPADILEPKLLPLVFERATQEFFHVYGIQKPDAIYRVLLEARESFIRLLDNRR